MHNLVPKFILDQYKIGEHHGSFPAVGMFVDISGFSKITDELMEHGQHGAEVLAEVMRGIFSPLVQSIYEHRGFISTLAGDAFTALFPLEGDRYLAEKHALASAWHIQQQLESIANQPTPYGEFSISGKVGMAKGEVNWGIVTSPDKRRAAYYIQGSAVEQSALAEQQAKTNEILLNRDFYAQVEKNITVEQRGDYYHLTGIRTKSPVPKPISRTSIDSEDIYRFFPRTLFDQESSGEFRQVVTLFVNLPTVRTEGQLDIFMQTLFDLQDKFGGLLTRLDFGDKGSNLLIFWGAPVSFENDIDRALNLILDLQIRTSIPINAGITYQIAHAGFIGSSLREEYSTYGRGVNLAARFMSAAQRGDIWIDEEIAKRAAAHFEIELKGEFSFKGFAQEQRIYLLEERKEVVETFYQTDMVGRQTELKKMEEFTKPLSGLKYCGALLISGEPGIGKTRLVHEFRKISALEDQGILWALCLSDQALRESLNPIRYWLRQYFAVSISQSEGRNKRNFNRKLDGIIASLDNELLASELDRTRSFIGALVDLYWPDSLFEQLDPQGRYDNTLIGLINLIQAESTLQPLILQIEDAQWLDEDSQKLLAQLERTIKSDESKSYPVAIIATARLEFTESGLDEGLQYHEIRLGELPPDSLELIADQLLAGSVSPELLELLLERADGNPFFAEQILHYLREEGLLKRGDTGWMVADHYLTPLPDNVRALLVSRLDRLTQEVKQVVLTAAVLGREFEIRLLSHMLNGDAALPEKVAAAEQNAIWSAVNELRYLFNQALLHDAAYRMQVRSHRQELHELAVNAIEGLYPMDLSSHSADLAYHCERAGLVDKARGHLIEAANAAKGVYRNDQAADYISRAIKITPPEDYQAKYELLLERESLFNLSGKKEEQLQDLKALNLLVESTQDGLSDSEKLKYRSKVEVRWANYLIVVGDYPAAEKSAQEVITITKKTAASDELVEAYFFWSLILFRQGSYGGASNRGVEGLSHANTNGDRDGESRILNLLGLIALEQEKLAEAQDYFKRSLRIAKEIGNLRDQAMPLNNLGNEALTGSDFSAAQNYYERSLKLARKIGNRAGEGLVLGNLGFIAGVQGDYLTAKEYNAQFLRSARQIGDRYQEAYAVINLSTVLRALKDYSPALEYANQGLSITKEIGDPNGEAWSLTSLGNIYFESGDLIDASEAFQAAFHIRQSLDQPNLANELQAGQARIALVDGDLQQALTFVNPILSYLDQGGSLEGTEEPIRIYLTCFEVLQQSEDTRAEGILETAYTQLQVRGAGIKDETMRQNYFENIPYNLQLISAWRAYHK